jgi:hypothetical protein
MPTLRAASAVLAPPPNPYVADPERLILYRDLAEPYGSAVDESLLRCAGTHVSHHELVEYLAQDPQVKDSRPDLIVVANALPDLHPLSVPAAHLNLLLGGSAVCIGISQQGLAAPFTALRTIAGYQGAGRYGEAVLAVLEQTTLPTRFPLVHDTPLADSGALLVFGGGAGPVLAGVEAFAAADTGGRLARLAGETPGTLVVLGPWFAGERPDGPDVLRLEKGTYCTSVWLELARSWQTWRSEYARVVLCDTEPSTAVTHLAVLTADSAGGDG